MTDKQNSKDNVLPKENSPHIQQDGERSTESEKNDDFDWDDIDSEEESDKQHVHYHHKHFFLCLSGSSSKLSWLIFIILTLISVAICIAIFVAVEPQHDPTMTSYNLALWFTFIAFMFCITLFMQMIIEVFPWLFKKLVVVITPANTEISRFKFLPYYLELRPYTKLVFIGAWAWGAWTFLRVEVDLPAGASRPDYVMTLELVWEILFLFTLFIFIEKFILQLIVTSFHRKAYSDRLVCNDRALRIFQKLKRGKKVSNPQDLLFRKIRKKNKNEEYYAGANTKAGKSIINQHPEKDHDQVVKFPSRKRLDTLIAIPPINASTSSDEPNKKNYLKNISDKLHEPLKSQELHKSKKSQQEHGDSEEEEDDDMYDGETETENEAEAEANKAQDADEEEEDRLDRNTRDYEGHKHPRLFRSSSSLSSISSDSYRSATSTLYHGYMKLAQESAFQDPIHQAKNLARHIYINIMGTHPSRTHMLESDFYPFFRKLSDAEAAFKLFDSDDNGYISRRELRSCCIRIYRERRDLARSMRDMSQATGKLNILFLVVFFVIWIIVSLVVFGVDVGTQLTPLWSAFIAASFIFGNSAKDAFESIIFIFVTHPFDTGDRILFESNNWIVSNVGIMVSTFLKLDGSVIYAKNSILATKFIINCRRTGRTSELFELEVSFHTPSWKIQELRDRMVAFNNKFPKLYTKDACGANIIRFQNLNKIIMTFFFEHTKNWQDAAGRWLRHNNFMLELKDQLQKLEITYSNPDQPVRLKYYGDEEKEEEEEEEDDDDKSKRYTGDWGNTSTIQNQAGLADNGGSASHGGTGGDSGDAGAAMGAAATVAYTTGAIE